MEFSDMDDHKINEINKLIASYSQSLPAKISAIILLIQQISNNINKTDLDNLRLKIHSIRGSAGVYGYHEITDLAAKLESIVIEIIKSFSITREQENMMNDLLLKMEEVVTTKQIDNKETIVFAQKNEDKIKKIIIVDNDENWQRAIISELQFLDYKILHYPSIQKLLDLPTTNEAIIFMISLALIDDKNIIEIKSQFPNSKIIYLSNINTFDNRLSAIKLSGSAFLEKPINTDEVIALIDKLKLKLENYYNVLIIGDDPEITNYYDSMLKQNNISVHVINNLKLTEAALHQYHPDLLLIDNHLSNVNCIELVTIIRQNKLYENIPIIFLATARDEPVQLHALHIGVDDFINKSLSIEYIIEKIKNKINRYKMIRSLIDKDLLTSTFNATFIKKQLATEIKECKKLDLPLTIALININKLNYINATYNYGLGDQLIKILCDIINTSIFAKYFIGRYTNNEIMIILSDCSLETAHEIMEIIQDKFTENTIKFKNKTFNASCSIGLATLSRNKTIQQLINEAYTKLFVEKEKNKNIYLKTD